MKGLSSLHVGQVLLSPLVKQDLSIVHMLRSTDKNPDELTVAGGIRIHTRSPKLTKRRRAYRSIRPLPLLAWFYFKLKTWEYKTIT